MKIWRCSTCGNGIRAPGRLRRNDVRRFCLSCSAKAEDNLLVERTCPSREIKRARAEEQRKEQDVRARERAAAWRAQHATSEQGQLEDAARRWCALKAWGRELNVGIKIRLSHVREPDQALIERTRASTDPETFKVWFARWGGPARPEMSSGHAYGSKRMVVTAGSDRADALTTIIHELAHLAAPPREVHGDRWRGLFAEAIREVTGQTPEPTGRTYQDLHTAAARCIRVWLEAESSGLVVAGRPAPAASDSLGGIGGGERQLATPP